MSAERMNSDEPPRELASDLRALEAELTGLPLAPSRVDRERLFFDAGRASAAGEPCGCAKKMRRERGLWAATLAASVTLALWLPAAFSDRPRVATSDDAASASSTAAAPAIPRETPIVAPAESPAREDQPSPETSLANDERPASPSPRRDPLENSRWAVAALAEALRGESREPDYLKLRNSVVARGVTIGLGSPARGAGGSSEPLAYGDFWRGRADF